MAILTRRKSPPPGDFWIQHPDPEFHCYYLNRNDLTVYSCKSHRILVPSLRGGYLVLGLGAKSRKIQLHIFSWETLNQRTVPNGMQVDHIDANPLNNILENLQILTIRDHCAKTRKDNPCLHKKMGLTRSKAVIATCIASGLTTSFSSATLAGRTLKISSRNISLCVRRKIKRIQGYSFALDEEFADSQRNLPDEVWCSVDSHAAQSYGLSVTHLKNIQVSSMGRVHSKDGRRTYGFPKHGYLKINVRNGALVRQIPVHVLVCLAFHGPRPTPTHTVDHVNRKPGDNRAANLHWATKHQQNMNRSTSSSRVAPY